MLFAVRIFTGTGKTEKTYKEMTENTTKKTVAAKTTAAKKTTRTCATKTAAAKTTTKAAAKKAAVIYVNAENAGFRAGDVYQILAASEVALSAAEIAEAAKVAVEDVYLGIGWLLKEGKIAATEDNKVVLA